MRRKFTLRSKLTIWYSSIVLLSIIAFAFYAYFWVSAELRTNLDASIVSVANAIDYIIEKNKADIKNQSEEKAEERPTLSDDKFALFKEDEKRRFIGPIRPGLQTKKEDKGIVWKTIFEHMLLNPQNYYIQLADLDDFVIWKSKNFILDSLPIHSGKAKNLPTNQKQTFQTFEDITFDKQEMRLLTKRTSNAIISIAYTVDDIEKTLNNMFAAILLSLPLVLLVAIGGGLILSKISLRVIDTITTSVNDITAKNLSLRLEETPTNDEIGRLVSTLNQMIERLEKQFNQIKQFSSDASHEMRTPLTILRGELEIALHSDQTVEDYNVVLASCLEEVIRLSTMVEQLLELSRGDSGQLKLVVSRNNLSLLLADLCEDVEILAESKDIIVNTNIGKDIYAEYDSHRIYQALLNVLDNAIKYNSLGGSIYISLRKDKKNVEISVKDTGIGIPEKELGNIFTRFYRVDKARSKDVVGTGLGLSIVKWIIDTHRGSIKVYSEVNRGTTFVIYLPIIQQV